MKNYILAFVVAPCILFLSCRNNDYPVPPASTVPQFSYSVANKSFAPAKVSFTNTSIVPKEAGKVDYYWNFGEIKSSSDVSPSYTYTKPGTYQVSLVVKTSKSLEIKKITKSIVIKDPNAVGVPLYFTNGTKIYQGLINSQQPVFTEIKGVTTSSSYGLVMDDKEKKIYLSDSKGGKIIKMNYDGSSVENFRIGLDKPIGLAIDYKEGKIYWTTSSKIQSANLKDSNISQKEDFVTGQTKDPDGLCIDNKNRKLYWINYDGGTWVKNLDGTGQKLLVPKIEGGSIILVKNRLYFDQYIGKKDIRLKSADLEGKNITTLATGIGKVVYGLAYEGSQNKIYWGDRRSKNIMRINIDGTKLEKWYSSKLGQVRGIVIGKK